MKRADLGKKFNKTSKKVLYINCCISWPLVSYSINFFSYEDSRTQGTLMMLNQQMKEISKRNTSLINYIAEVREQ